MTTVIAAIILKEGKVLIAQRAQGQNLAGKWEFPGGKIKAGETPEECLKREIKEELDLDIEVDEFFGENIYSYETGTIRLVAYKAQLIGGQCRLKVHSRVEWVKPHDLAGYDFSPADVPFVEKLGRNCWKWLRK
ncbi:MAG: (deoxy)nucleoside triphosphate pyrophosphohydrolase [Clostridiales bacterium]|nr:(deoxy)nucleoside triphosphate pyrophosphohydrolase [Clostridiales bacterium]